MGTRSHRNTSYEPLTTFLRRTMRSRQEVLFIFGSFLPMFGCHFNSLGSLEILDSIFIIADPANPTIPAKFVSISCSEMKLCLSECLGLSWQPPWHPWIFVCHIWIRRPRKPFNYVKNSSISCTELNSLWFWHGFFLFKFGWHGNSLGFLKNSDSVLKLPNPEIPTVHAKNFSISCRELMSAIFFTKFGCHGNRADSHEILYTMFEFADPENLLIMW